MTDVDRFKEVNDRSGHLAGDALLRDVAMALRDAASTVAGSLVALLGGDEFCVVLPHSTLFDAERFARGVGRSIRLDAARGVSLSWGAASFGPLTGSGHQLIAAADTALLEAKRARSWPIQCGRGRTHGLPRPDRRPSSDATLRRPEDDLTPCVVRMLDEHSVHTTAAVLEILAVQVCSTIDAAAWAISVTSDEGTSVQTLRGIDSTRDGISDLRVLATAEDTVYALARFPATAQAITHGEAFIAAIDLEDSDPAEVALLKKFGYHAVLGVGVRDDQRRYLLEIVCDHGHAELAAVATHVRVLAHSCTIAKHERR